MHTFTERWLLVAEASWMITPWPVDDDEKLNPKKGMSLSSQSNGAIRSLCSCTQPYCNYLVCFFFNFAVLHSKCRFQRKELLMLMHWNTNKWFMHFLYYFFFLWFMHIAYIAYIHAVYKLCFFFLILYSLLFYFWINIFSTNTFCFFPLIILFGQLNFKDRYKILI